MTDEETKSDNKSDDKAALRFIPAIQDFQKRYATSFEGNDQKAARLFREYESKEKLNRIRSELMAVKEGSVAEHICVQVIGKKRAVRFGSYRRWAELMLLWFVSK